MTKLVIFDLDGTLIDTCEDIANACNYALEQCGYPTVPLEEYNMLVGRGIDNLFRGALPEGHKSEDMVAKMRSIFVPYYNEHKCDFTKPYEGIMEALEVLSAKGLRFAVASNKYQEGTEQLVSRYFGKYDFTAVLGQREGKPIKPDAGIIYEAIGLSGAISTDEVIYCGDSNVDMETGKNAGVKTIGVTWGFRDRAELSAYDPWLIVDNPGQIYSAIDCDIK